MSKKKTPTGKNQIWIEAQKKYHLSDAHIQMAKELGLNPKKFGELANTKQEPWKAPLPDFIEEIHFTGLLYSDRFCSELYAVNFDNLANGLHD